MSNGVPLWAFLLTTLAAVLGPFLTTWLTNTHARKVLQQQHQYDRQAWLRDHKHEVYDNALRQLGLSKLGILQKDGVRLLFDALAATARLYAYGSPLVISRAKEVEAEGLRFAGTKSAEAQPQMEAFFRTIDDLGDAIRDDLASS